MNPSIVILSHRADEHALAVLSSLSASANVFMLDIGRTGSDFVVKRNQGGSLSILTRNGKQVRFDEPGFWWNRRPRVQAFEHTAPKFVAVQEAEIEEFWTGALGVGAPGHWCNPFDAQRSAQQKVRQFGVARNVGLRVPETVWTNDPTEVESFLEHHPEGVIFKMFTGTESVWQPCRRLNGALIDQIRHARFMPAIYQEYIGGDAEYRVTLFGNHGFAARADLSKSRYPADVRIDLALKREAVPLEPTFAAKLRALMRALGLSYATFDIREDKQGEPVFLECNPMGQFLYLDGIFAGEILKSFCNYAESFATSLEVNKEPAAPSPCQSVQDLFAEKINVPIYEAAADWATHIE